MSGPRLIILTLLSVFALTGCKEVLFSNLEEIETNEMVAILEAAGISSSRVREKDAGYNLLVEEVDIGTATTLLRNEGYPKEKFATLGDIFSADGIVGTPFEQHARYIHAMNQELSRTISTIDGVSSARVFITAPAKERYAREAPRASASITINYESNFKTQENIPKVKLIVAHSVPNLDYDDVAIAMFRTAGPALDMKGDLRVASAGDGFMSSLVMQLDHRNDKWRDYALIAALVFGVCMLAALLGLVGSHLYGRFTRSGDPSKTAAL